MGGLSVVEHRLRLLVVLFADDNLGGHGPYRVDGRHVFVADRGEDAFAFQQRFSRVDQIPALSSIDLAISASVMVLYSASTTNVSSCIILRFLVRYLKLSILSVKCNSPAMNSSIKKHYLRPEPERGRIPAKQVVRHLIIPPIYIIFVVAKF